MKECVLITVPPINLDNLLSLSEDRSFHDIYIGGRFKVIDFLIGNFERVGFEDFIIITNHDSIKNHLPIAWNNLKILTLLEEESNFSPLYSNFTINQYTRFNQEINKNMFDLENFILQNYRKIYWVLGYPIWFPLENYISEIKNLSIALLYSKIGTPQYYHTAVLSQRYFEEALKHIKNKTYNLFLSTYRENNSYETDYFLFFPFTNLKEYFKMNLSILDWRKINEIETIFGKYPIRTRTEFFSPAIIGRHGTFSNSLIGDNSFVDGIVESSIVCPNVKIERDSKIRNTIIYPGNWIGKNIEANNVIIDEVNITLKYPNVGDSTILGGKGLGAPNTKYPSIMNFDATLIGKNVIIPSKTQVSLNAYIPSNTDLTKMKIGKYIKSSTNF
ncbi:MAG: hypothetical protein ACP5KI_02255 [Brevinematia bacterium]